MEFHVAERLTRTVHRNLVVSCAVGVVEGGRRGAALGNGPQIPDRLCVAQSASLEIQGGLLKLQQIENFNRIRDLALLMCH